MAAAGQLFLKSLFLFILASLVPKCYGNDILGCGGFVKSHVSLDFSKIEIGLYTKAGSLKERTECAPTNGYYFLPLYEKGEYVLKVHPPAGWSFEPSQVDLTVDGTTDPCSTNQDINFAFNGFGITGKVITAGQTQGPSGIAVELVDDKGEKRDTITSVGGDFHFTPVIPGKYTLKASHPRWKLDPVQAVVQVKEGNTALPAGVLAVKGYDVKGSITSFGSPIGGVYVLLYSKEENPKFRVEGCKTSLLQGVPDAPICHTVTESNGEFTFGLVPAGEYKLLALAQPPGQATIRYNIKPDAVPFSIAHDSLYIKNAFEVTGFTLVGSVTASPSGQGIAGARVLKDGQPVGNTDASGKFTLPSLQPGTYSLSFQHEQCEFDDFPLVVTPTGPGRVPAVRAARWRVCGAVAPADDRLLSITGDKGTVTVRVTAQNNGKWCTFLPSGVYTAKVDVSEAERREGLQFYPLNRKISVAHAPVDGVAFSQLKAKLSGKVQCKTPKACENLQVTMRPLSPDGGYVGQPTTTTAKNGEYTFEDVLPGSVEVSVPSERLCWAEARHNVAVATEIATVPAFEHTGYVVKLHSSHDIEVEYSSKSSKGVFTVPSGWSAQCVTAAEKYTLTPRGPHRFQPTQATVDTTRLEKQSVQFVATAHAVVIKVMSPDPVQDLVLKISSDNQGRKQVGPLVPLTEPQGGYSFQHTLFMQDGEIAVVSAESSSLLFQPGEPQQVLGRSQHQPEGLLLRAVRGLTLAGKLVPPVEDVLITLSSGDTTLTQTTTKDGTYSFGPLDASKDYKITAEKESYVFGDRDENGNIAAHKLAEITVELVDDADGTPLVGGLVSVSGGQYRRNAQLGAGARLRFPALSSAQYYVKPNMKGGLVSVSGGQYRRNAQLGAGARLRFPALSSAQYYVKPNMKEYKFSPPHHIQNVLEGQTHHVVMRGVRVAWSCLGQLVSLGGVGWGGLTVIAVPQPNSPSHCAMEEATTETNGAFRIRGLLPKCIYSLQLKESNNPDTQGLKLAKAPPMIEIKQNKDIVNVRLLGIQPPQLTDVSVRVRATNVDHYKALRLTLALDNNLHTPLYSTKLDASGYSQYNNPGVMYVLPRLPADNKTYVLQLESSLSKSTHSYEEEVHYFNSDGKFKAFDIEFSPKVKSSEQELRQTSLLVIPLLGVLVLAYCRRDLLLAHASQMANNALRPTKNNSREPRQTRQELLDKASIDHILSTVNAAGKRTAKKKTM